MLWLGVLLIAVIVGMGLFLFIVRPPTALVLPVAAILLALVAFAPQIFSGQFAEPLNAIFGTVIGAGFTRLSALIVAVVLGAVLAAQVEDAGIAKFLVRYAAEFSGDSPFMLTLLLTLVIALLFTNLGGLGAVIMVATTALPLMLAMGLEPLTAGAVFLLALSLGGCLNPVNWQLYISVLGLPQERIIPYALTLFVIFLAVTAAFVFVRVHREQGVRKSEMAATVAVAVVFIVASAVILRYSAAFAVVKLALFWLLAAVTAALTIAVLARLFTGAAFLPGRVHALSIAALIYPLLLLLTANLGKSLGYFGEFSLGIVPALFLGVLYAHAASWTPAVAKDSVAPKGALASRRRAMAGRPAAGGEANRVMRACYGGFKMAIPAILLLFGIGMLLQATMLPEVTEAVRPLITGLIPRTPVLYIAAFTVFAPLALYRGPLNLYGMGSGIVGLLMEAGKLAAPLLMVAFFSVGMMQGVCDPTNTHNAWLAGFLRVRVLDLTRATIAWVWLVAFLGLLAGAIMFGGGF